MRAGLDRRHLVLGGLGWPAASTAGAHASAEEGEAENALVRLLDRRAADLVEDLGLGGLHVEGVAEAEHEQDIAAVLEGFRQSLRVRGRGLPKGKSAERGDFFVKLQIVLPTKLSDAERTLWEQLRSASTFNPRA